MKEENKDIQSNTFVSHDAKKTIDNNLPAIESNHILKSEIIELNFKSKEIFKDGFGAKNYIKRVKENVQEEVEKLNVKTDIEKKADKQKELKKETIEK